MSESPADIPSCVPKTLLVLGTDAAGKDFVANFIAGHLAADGHEVEKRAGWFSARASRRRSSEDKGRLARYRERVFLAISGLTQWLIPVLLPAVIAWDLRRFRPSSRPLIVVSSTALRVLAFYLGQRYTRPADIQLPRRLDRSLRAIIPSTQVRTLVLDIQHTTRQRRIAKRVQRGTVDPFDAYMAHDSERAERIEGCLLWLARTYLDAVTIENDDLDEAALRREIGRAFARFHGQVAR